ncbi:MAG: hypothetical protein IIC71_02105 [Acidobacteria bacterium]|nr:hypothetical protein [Acidobacteriota bacterium]
MSKDAGSEVLYCSAGVQILRDPVLAAQGWQRRTVTDPARVGELEELYASLDFETTTAALDPSSFGDACTSCAVTACATYVALYTRKRETS